MELIEINSKINKMNNVKDYYQILNVKRSASDEEIATA
jgi:curved DNA-binding protein CbpA